jgi:hypothetical protein
MRLQVGFFDTKGLSRSVRGGCRMQLRQRTHRRNTIMSTASNSQPPSSYDAESPVPGIQEGAPSSSRSRKSRRLAGLAGSAGLIAIIGAGLSGCGSTDTRTISNAAATTPAPVAVVVTSPTSGSVIAANNVIVRGTVDPSTASVEIQGKPAAVGNGVFTGTATLHPGKTTIDIIGSAPNEVPGSTNISVTEQTDSPSGHSGASAPPPSAPNATSSATPGVAYEQPAEYSSGQTSCGGGLAVGPDTTCAFAENVRNSYEDEGPGTYEVYSPVTEQTYRMSCSYGTPVVCTGGNDASVYFP